jgi:hypothetical protein
VREIVIVIADLYLPRAADAAAPEVAAPEVAAPEVAAAVAAIPGIEAVGRFGVHAALARGWREWLARWVGRADLTGVAPACVAAAALPDAALPDAALPDAADDTTVWIATPLQLSAGLARVHLDHRGMLRLPAAELTALAADFGRTFGSSGCSLTPLASGDFLLTTRGIERTDTTEPARAAGNDVAAALPRGPAAAALRRLVAEIEMWLHGQGVNVSRRLRGEPPVTTLWPWGSAGRIVRPELRAARDAPLAFGTDAWLAGLWHLQGGACRALPDDLRPVLADVAAERAVLVAQGGAELQHAEQATFGDALARLDERFVSPALRALRRGELTAVTLIVNDARATVQRPSLLKLWRRPRAGLASFA